MSCGAPPLYACTGFEALPPEPVATGLILLGAAGGMLLFALVITAYFAVDAIIQKIRKARI